MQNPNDFLESLKSPSGTEGGLDVTALIKSAHESFLVIEPWYTARNNAQHPLFDSMVENLAEEAENYLNSITLSLQVAEYGWTLSNDAVSLCGFVSGENYSVDQVKSFVRDMQRLAQKGQGLSGIVLDRFRNVRQGLFTISRQIPVDIEEVRRQGGPGAFEDGLNTKFVTMQVPFQAGIFINKSGSYARSVAQRSFSEIIDQFKRTAEDLTVLLKQATCFVDWWNHVKTRLDALEKTIPQIQPKSLRLQNVLNEWTHLRGQFDSYRSQICIIQDFYPTLSCATTITQEPYTPEADTQSSKKPPLDLDLLTTSASKSFEIIEFWYSTRGAFHHELVAEMINKIVGQSERYFRVIDDSIQAAQKACMLAEKATTVWKHMSEHDSFVNHIKDMFELTGNTYKQTKEVLRHFIEVRGEILWVLKRIPLDSITIQLERGGQGGIKALVAIAPVPLPNHASFISDKVVHRGYYLSNGSELLPRASQDLNELVEHITQFISRWKTMKTNIGALQSAIPKLERGSELDSLKTTVQCQIIKETNTSYKRLMAFSRDIHAKLPPQRYVRRAKFVRDVMKSFNF